MIDHTWNNYTQETDQRENRFSDSISQYSAEIEIGSLFLFCTRIFASRENTINIGVLLNRDWILTYMVTQPQIKPSIEQGTFPGIADKAG